MRLVQELEDAHNRRKNQREVGHICEADALEPVENKATHEETPGAVPSERRRLAERAELAENVLRHKDIAAFLPVLDLLEEL